MTNQLSIHSGHSAVFDYLVDFKNFAIQSLIVSLMFLLSPTPVSAAEAGDVINLFRSTIILSNNSKLFVRETIEVDFGNNRHHGIVRTIPCTAMIKGDKKRIHIAPIDSTCDGVKVENSLSLDSERFQIKIGDPNRTLTGMHRYTIEYYVHGAVRLSKNYPELYWNITGNDWKMPIRKAVGTLVLPTGLPSSLVNACSFEGYKNSTAYASTKRTNTTNIEFNASNLAPGQGLTLAANFPPDSIQIPGLISEWAFYLGETGLIIASLIAFACGLWPVGVFLLLIAWFWGSSIENANWDRSGSSSLDFGSSGGGFGGGGGDTW